MFKKGFVSLGILGAVGGSGAGIYYSLKEDNIATSNVPSSNSESVEVRRTVDTEETSRNTAAPDVGNNLDNNVREPVSVSPDSSISDKSSTAQGTLPPQQSDSSTGERSSESVVSNTGSQEEVSSSNEQRETVVNTENPDAIVQTQPGDASALENSQVTPEDNDS